MRPEGSRYANADIAPFRVQTGHDQPLSPLGWAEEFTGLWPSDTAQCFLWLIIPEPPWNWYKTQVPAVLGSNFTGLEMKILNDLRQRGQAVDTAYFFFEPFPPQHVAD